MSQTKGSAGKSGYVQLKTSKIENNVSFYKKNSVQ